MTGKYCTDCKIFTDRIEDSAKETIQRILDNPAFKDSKVRIMPDVHDGKGIVIGFTAPIGNALNPDHVGCDIGCCIDSYILSQTIDPSHYAILDHRIRKTVPFGVTLCDTRQFEMKEFIKFLKSEWSKAKQGWPEMIQEFDFTEKGLEKFISRVGIDPAVFYKSLGTVGGGNHFIEIGKTPSNLYTLTIHTGSRNLGVKVWKYWSRIAAKGGSLDKKELRARQKWIKENTPDRTQIGRLVKEAEEEMKQNLTPTGYLSGDDLSGYITDMVITQAYAKFNHHIIARNCIAIFSKLYPGIEIKDYICSTHNYIDLEDRIIRKGSIRAYSGERMIIPFNMQAGLAVCEGLGNEDWNCSGPHGAGRIMSRTKALENLSMDEFKDKMKDIYSTSVCNTTLDESPMAYKPVEEILELIKPTCNVLYMIEPVINLKDTSGHD